jgi:hypothetical protein
MNSLNGFYFFFLMAAVSFDLTAQVSPFLDAHLVVPLLDFLLEKEVGKRVMEERDGIDAEGSRCTPRRNSSLRN